MTTVSTKEHAATASCPDWEKEFFITWLRLMERQREGKDLTQTLQNILSQPVDASTKLLDVKHHADIMSVNEKTMSDVMAQLNNFFFRNVVDALERARNTETANPTNQKQHENPLDWYLEHGEDGPNGLEDWTGPASVVGQKKKRKYDRKAKKKDNLASQEINGSERSNDKNHDMTEFQSTESLSRTRGRVSQEAVMAAPTAPVHHQGNVCYARIDVKSFRGTKSSSRSKGKGKGKEVKSSKPAINTSTQSKAVSKSKLRTETQSLAEFVKNNRIIKKFTADLVAKKVLDVRSFAKSKEFLIQWQGVATPLWITHRKSPSQAKELIDAFVATLQSRSKSSSRRTYQDGEKKTERPGTPLDNQALEDHSPRFYPVGQLLAHRDLNNKRQYLVQWENFPESYNTWESADSLRLDVPRIVDAYEKKLQQGHSCNGALPSAKEVTKSKSTSDSSGGDIAENKKAHVSLIRKKRKRCRIAFDTENERKEATKEYNFDVEVSNDDKLNQC